MAGEAVASPMRPATAPGRLARPAPPGNNDPCGERRTIPEGLPRLPREALMMRLQTGGSNPPKPLAKGDRQRRARARARNPTWSAVKASVPVAWYAGRLDASRDGCLGLRISIAATGDLWCATNARRALARACRSMGRPQAGHGLPIGVRRKHPSATGAPHAPREGAAKMRKEGSEERKEMGMSRESEEM